MIFFKRINFIKIILLIVMLLISSCQIQPSASEPTESKTKDEIKLYWFIPDGMRADPDLFNIFKWAQEGKLPNIKKLMDNGAYGFSIPTFPSHTPTNFATLFTGTYPKRHGVADGPMHVEGFPLDRPSLGGFSSVAKKIPPIWKTLEEKDKKIILLSVPGSTPPELEQGITVRGRWGGWGADFHALNFELDLNKTQRISQGRSSRLFFFGPQLTNYIKTKKAFNWKNAPKSYSEALQTKLEAYETEIHAYIYDSTNDNKVNYDRILFSFDKQNKIADLSQGVWSDWASINLSWNNQLIESHVNIVIIKLDDDGFFRIRLFFNNLNRFIVDPSEVYSKIEENVGPAVDFVDNFPPQLIYYPEDKETFISEANMSLNWHKKAFSYLFDEYKPDIFIHDIYTPNQMLTSRWWMGYIDPSSARYNDVTEEEREKLWQEVQWMYKKLDDIIGEALEKADINTFIILSSDHGVVPLNQWVRINNLLAKNGLLKFTINPKNGEPIIDWENSKAIYLKMDNIYINPDGLEGNWTRASGPEYDRLREKIVGILLNLKDENGEKPVAKVITWENAHFLELPKDRVGDLIIANKAGYGWNEEMTEDLRIFDVPLKTGYKQAILSEGVKGMWTPFIIMGPGVKKGFEIKEPIQHVDQYPTIMQLMGFEIPSFVEGKVLEQIFE